MSIQEPIARDARGAISLRDSAEQALRALGQASQASLDTDLAPLDEGAETLRAIQQWMVRVLDQGPGGAEWVEGDVHAAARVVRAGTPMLLGLEPRNEGPQGPHFVVLHEGDGDGLRISLHGPQVDPVERVLPSDALAELLGADEETSRRWLVCGAPAGEPHGPTAAPRTPWQRLGDILQPDRADLLAVLLYAVALGFLLLATPIAVQALVNFVAMGGANTPLVVVTALLFVGLAFAGVIAGIQTWLVEILQRRLFARTVAHLGARLPRVKVDVYDDRHGPELVNRFFDVMTMQKAGAALLLDGLGIVLTVLVGLVLLAFYHPLLLAFDFVLVGCIAAIVLGPVRRGVRTAISESHAKYQVVDWLEGLARHPKLFRSGGLHTWVAQRSEEVVGAYLESRRVHFRVLFGQIVSAHALHVLASTALLGIGGFLVVRGGLTLGQLVAAELIVTLIVASVAKMGKQLGNYYDLMAATDKVGQLLDLPLEPLTGVHQVDTTGADGVRLEVRGLAASRAGSPPLFEGLEFEVPSGERLALCGPSGAGKSTLLELLWGLRGADSGSIRVDGQELGALSLEAYRASVALASEVDVVGASVRDNVRVGRTFVSERDVGRALDVVGLTAAVDRLSEGVGTSLNSRGWPLSESEVRALQVARVLADPPRMVLISEAVLPDGGDLRRRCLDALLAPDAPWTAVIVSNAADVQARVDRVLDLPGGVSRRPEPSPSPDTDPQTEAAA